MLASEYRAIIKDRPLVAGLLALVVGQLLYSVVGFGALYAVALLYVLVVGLPYPALVRSVLARVVVAVPVAFGFVQLAAAVQFYVARTSKFGVLSFITTVLVVAAVVVCYRFRAKKEQIQWAGRKDIGALVAAAFFVVPLSLWCFGPVRMTSFGGLQSPDGSAHNAGLGEMAGSQHLTYRTNPNYYPKGFHLAQALFMDDFHVLQRQQTWTGNVWTYLAQYVIWGFVVAYLLYYVAYWMAERLIKKLRQNGELLLAVLLGSALSVFYLLPFAQEGFLNYYYICAAFMAGLLFLPGFALKDKADHWLVAGYFLCAFGIATSWGPLLLPALTLTPLLFVLPEVKEFADLKKKFWQRRYLTPLLGYAALLVPLYIHFKYSHSTSFNAEGSIRVFNVGLLMLSVGLLAYAAFSQKLQEDVKAFVQSVFWPYVVLVALLAAAQFVTVGEARYYTIKTAYLLEMVTIAVLAVLVVRAVLSAKVRGLQLWLCTPVVFAVGLFAVLCLGGNPLQTLRSMLNQPLFLAQDTQKIAQLGQQGNLHGHNNAVLHYDAGSKKIVGNELIPNWANGLSPDNDGNAETAACNSVIYNTLTYGSGSPDEQKTLIEALKKCITLRTQQQGKPYFIVTDPDSVPYLKRILGDRATFL